MLLNQVEQTWKIRVIPKIWKLAREKSDSRLAFITQCQTIVSGEFREKLIYGFLLYKWINSSRFYYFVILLSLVLWFFVVFFMLAAFCYMALPCSLIVGGFVVRLRRVGCDLFGSKKVIYSSRILQALRPL